MAEHDEHEPGAEGAGAPAPRDQGDGTPPAAHASGGTAPPASGGGVVPESGTAAMHQEGRGTTPPPGVGGPPPEYLSSGGDGPPRGPGRLRRWSANGQVRMGAVTLAAGLIGGLVGGGIVAAFSDNGDDGGRSVRVERVVPFGDGGPGFRPRYWGPPGGGWVHPNRPGMPMTPSPVPSPKATG